jgi:hypothetical protein
MLTNRDLKSAPFDWKFPVSRYAPGAGKSQALAGSARLGRQRELHSGVRVKRPVFVSPDSTEVVHRGRTGSLQDLVGLPAA